MANKKTEVRRVLDKVKAEARTSLTAPEGKLVCDAYGIQVPKEGVAKSAAEAAKLATSIGYPVVLKVISPEILHKTEAGAVIVGVKNAAEARKGFEAIMANAKRYNRKATLLGVQVQQMLGGGQEVIVGAVTDPSFGKLVAFGLGVGGLARVTPTSFLPEEDQGAFFVQVQLPDGVSVARTSEAVGQVEAVLKSMPQVKDTVSIIGYSFLDSFSSSNTAFMVAVLQPFEDRKEAADSAQALIMKTFGATKMPPPTRTTVF